MQRERVFNGIMSEINPSPKEAGNIAREAQRGREVVLNMGGVLGEAFRTRLGMVNMEAEGDGREKVGSKVGKLAEAVVETMARTYDVRAVVERGLEGFDRAVVDVAEGVAGVANEKLIGAWGTKVDKSLQAEATRQMGWDALGVHVDKWLRGVVKGEIEAAAGVTKRVAPKVVETFGRMAGSSARRAEGFEDKASSLREWVAEQKKGKAPEASMVVMETLTLKMQDQAERMAAMERELDGLKKSLLAAGNKVGGPAFGSEVTKGVPSI